MPNFGEKNKVKMEKDKKGEKQVLLIFVIITAIIAIAVLLINLIGQKKFKNMEFPDGNKEEIAQFKGIIPEINSKQEYEAATKEDISLIVFYLDTCRPCKIEIQNLIQLKKEKENLKIYLVNKERHQEIAQEHGVFRVPALKLYKKGELKGEHVGIASREYIMEKMEAKDELSKE